MHETMYIAVTVCTCNVPTLTDCQVPVIILSHAHLSINAFLRARLNTLSGRCYTFVHRESFTVNKFVLPLPQNFCPSKLSPYAVSKHPIKNMMESEWLQKSLYLNSPITTLY